jgi:hypothetical protein
MKRVSIAVAAVAFAFPALAAGGTAAQPSLRLLKLTPPSAHGTHFKAGEKVGVTLRSGKATYVRTVHVSGKGQFTVVFGGVTLLDRCGQTPASLIAVGALGDRIVVKVPQTGCTPAGSATTPGATSTTTPGSGSPYMAPPPPYTK